ncbi:MAG TPA: HEAT repeat domain-containing protein [Gemmataceae bacterium]|nr:HEAT repeat domain-containing protein [Gemmataceae bacterium]
MTDTAKKILRLLHPDQPLEVRCAAVLVLGEVGGKDAELTRALSDALQDGEAQLRLQVIKAVGKLRIEAALPRLLERIKDGGEEAEQAAQAAAKLGAKGTRALQELMPKVAPGLRRYIAAALAAAGTASAETAAVAVLLDRDPGVVESAGRSLLVQVPGLTPAHRKALADQLLELMKNKKEPLSPPATTVVLRLLAALDDPRAEAVLWERIVPPYPLEVRAAALQALGKWAASPGKEQLKRLFACATDSDFRLAAPALVLLKDLPVGERTVPEWLTLLQASDVAVRKLALDKIGGRDTAEVAAALLQQIHHPDRSLRDGALARLTRLKLGQKALTTALLEADSPDKAWTLARAQAPFARAYPAEWRENVFAQVCDYLESNDRRGDALLFLLREADAAELRRRLEERAIYWRKKKAYETALLYLRLLIRDPSSGFPIRFELACCGLKASSRDLSPEARANDPCLQQFATLWQGYEAELATELEKTKWLEPDDLYYLGFHFAEQVGQQKQLGGKALRLLVKRSPRTKLAQAAKRKLRGAGLE